MPLIPSRNPWQRKYLLVREDLLCIHCSYNLRGLPLGSRCPECGETSWDALFNTDLAQFKRAMTMARYGCVALALWPALGLMLTVLQNDLSNNLAASIAALVLSSAILLTAASIWAILPLPGFGLDGDHRLRFIAGGAVAALASVGAALARAPIIAEGVRSELANVLLFFPVAILYFFLLGVVHRLLTALRYPKPALAIRALRLLCAISATAIAFAVLDEMTFQSWWLPSIANPLCILTFVAATALMLLTQSLLRYNR